MAGRILAGRYELIEKIGEGGMAVVFKSRDRLLNRLVAIKILRPEFTKDAVFVESFRRESQVAASLAHPNIVNVYDVGREANINYIVMELIDGQPLSDMIKAQGALDPRFATSVAKQVASALSTAHKHNLIHRDVKPHNILITSEGVAKITDFGIAKPITEDTLTGDDKKAVMGSVHYFSPEQARGGYVDEKSDIYSLGIVLYEMLTGKVPFDGETAVEVAVKHINEEMVPPSQINPDIPADLEKIVMRATQKVQTNRYRSADEMITELNFVKFSRHIPSPEEVAAKEAEEEEEKNERRFVFGRKDEDKPKRRHPAHEPASEESDAEEDEDEDDNLAESGPNSVKRYAIGRGWQRVIAILLAFACAIGIGTLIFRDSKKEPEPGTDEPGVVPIANGETFELENYAGRDFDEVSEELTALGLKVEIDMQLPSSTIDAGIIMSQTPDEGTMVKSGYTVRFNVSKGAAEGKVPSVVGKTLKSAKQLVESYRYNVGSVAYANSKDIPVDYVISQSPVAGTSLAANGTVNLTVSLGPELSDENSVDLAGYLYEDAEAEIVAKGFNVGSVKYAFDDEIPEECVISHTPGPGVAITLGSNIDLVVSKGPENPPVVDPFIDPAVDPTIDPSGGGDESLKSHSLRIIYDGVEGDFNLSVYCEYTYKGEKVSKTIISNASRNGMQGYEDVTVTGTGYGTVVVMFDNNLKYNYTYDFDTGNYY